MRQETVVGAKTLTFCFCIKRLFYNAFRGSDRARLANGTFFAQSLHRVQCKMMNREDCVLMRISLDVIHITVNSMAVFHH